MTKILAVDDDVQILKLIRNALAKEGYEVTVQSDPLELKKMKPANPFGRHDAKGGWIYVV